jgi:hypothetical protein
MAPLHSGVLAAQTVFLLARHTLGIKFDPSRDHSRISPAKRMLGPPTEHGICV